MAFDEDEVIPLAILTATMHNVAAETLKVLTSGMCRPSAVTVQHCIALGSTLTDEGVVEAFNELCRSDGRIMCAFGDSGQMSEQTAATSD